MLFYLSGGRHFLFMERKFWKDEKGKKHYILEPEKKKEKIKSWRWLGCSENRWFEGWKGLTPTQRSIMVSLWLYAGSKSFCYPSERVLADRLNLDLTTIWKNIKILKRKKYFKIEKQKGKYNKYFLLK